MYLTAVWAGYEISIMRIVHVQLSLEWATTGVKNEKRLIFFVFKLFNTRNKNAN